MKADHYHEAINAVHGACRGTMDGSWNMSFMSELKARGLTLTATMPAPNLELYPHDGLPYQAPLSFGDRHGWAYRSYVVWLPEIVTDRLDSHWDDCAAHAGASCTCKTGATL